MDILIIVFLVALGICLIILEVFFLPGITIAGIGAAIFLLGAIYYAFSQLGHIAGLITIGVSAVGAVGGLYWFMRSKALDRMSLQTNIDSVVPTSIHDQIKPGNRGKTVSRLNPMGRVLIGDQVVEGRALDDFIDEETPVEVERVERTTVIVRPISVNSLEN